MSELTQSRTYALVEELRADIDFELEDVITEIVRELPEEYFQRVPHKDQLVHLKALLALSFCKLQEELMFRSSDGVHTAVIARQNYSGQLSSILKRLPTDRALTGAKIFTSVNHDFIIDLFEFEPTEKTGDEVAVSSEKPLEESIAKVAAVTETDTDVIREFISHYPPTSLILDHPGNLAEHFFAAREVQEKCCSSIRTREIDGSKFIRLTVASREIRTRQLVELVAEYLGHHEIDIEKAFLNELSFADQAHIAIASFELLPPSESPFDVHKTAIKTLLASKVVDCQ